MKAYIESSDGLSTREASRLRTKALLLILTTLFIVALFSVPRTVSPVHAPPSPGTVCIVPLDAVAGVGGPCRPGVDFTNPAAANSTGVTFTGPPVTTPPAQLIVGVFINGSDIYLGFDITLKADPRVLTPADADLTGSTLTGSPSVNVKCIGGHLESTSGVCPPTDTLDTIHFGASQGVTITTAGLLFRAIWNITGTSTAGAPIAVHFQTGCGTPTAQTSIAPGVSSVCITMINGSLTPTAETFRTSLFDNSAGATTPFVTVTAPTVSFGTRSVGDPTVAETLTYTSNNAFSDVVGLSATAASFAVPSPTCSGSLNSTSITPAANGVVHVGLTITATAAGSCGVTILGTYSLGTLEGFANSTFLVAPITVSVNFVDFSLAAGPTLVRFLTTGTGTSTITVGSLNGFAGNVALSTTSTLNTTAPFLKAAFNTNPVPVPATGSGASTATFSAGVAATTYTVTLKGSTTISGFMRTKAITLTVVEQDFTIQVTGLTLITFIAGGSGSTTFTVSSKPPTANGFTGSIAITRVVNATGLSVTCPTSVTLSIGGSTSPAQTCNFSSSTPGSYKVTITGNATASGTSVTHAAIVSVIVTPRTTSTIVVCSPGSVVVNQQTSCTATVSDTSSSGTAITPTGSVGFSSNSTGTFTSTSCTLTATATAGVADCSVSYTPSVVGHHVVSGMFAGDSAHSGSSGSMAVIVASRATSTTVGCNPSAVDLGRPTVCTATVTDTSTGTPITPTGSVGFTTNSTGAFTPSTSCTLVPTATTGTASCQVTYTPGASAVGSHMINGTYSGDTVHVPSRGSGSVIVGEHPTTTAVACSPTSVIVNQATQCTATVTDAFVPPTNPTGTVSFSSNSTGTFTPTSCTLVPSTTLGVASCVVSYTPSVSGNHKITGGYAGDAGPPVHLSSSGSATVPASLRTTTTAVNCTPATVLVNQGAQCTATVSDSSSAGTVLTPAGTVAFTKMGAAGFFSGSPCTLVASVTLGTATCTATFTPSASGAASVNAAYTAATTDTAHSGSSTTTSFAITVNLRVTTTSVSCVSPVVLNQGSLCTVTVTDSPSNAGTALTPVGTVAFTGMGAAGSFSGSPCTLMASATVGTASCSATFTPSGLGTATVNAAYAPTDTAHSSSSSTTAASITVNLRVTTTTLSCASPVVLNQGSLCTATVTDTSLGAALTPTGSVSFASNSTGGFSATSCTLASTATVGVASCSVNYTPSLTGSHGVTGTFAGDVSHSGSNGAATVAAGLRTTTTSVACSPASLSVNQAAQCTATVSDSSSAGTALTPGGSVAFASSATGSLSMSSCSLTATSTVGISSCSVSYTPTVSGDHGITGSYGGDSHYSGSNNSVTITASSVGNVFGLPGVEFYGILAAVLVVAAVAAGLFFRTRRRVRPKVSAAPQKSS